MATITGVLLLPNADYGKSVSVVDVHLNGQSIELTYIEGGKLKAGSISCVQNPDGSLPAAMSGCTIV
jgi:hypothetical protein